MAVVVGYVPTKEGRAALRRACEESLLRRAKLIVINSSRGGKDFDATEARRFEAGKRIGNHRQFGDAGIGDEQRALEAEFFAGRRQVGDPAVAETNGGRVIPVGGGE